MALPVYKQTSLALKLCFIVLLLAVGCGTNEQHKLRVATAANVQYAVADIAHAFYEHTGIKVEMVVGSSGKLSTQITQGAPFDVFISADMDYPMELYRNGFSVSEPELYAYGEIIILTTGKLKPSLEALTSENVNHIAIPNPKTAPYGVMALDAIKNANLLDKTRSRLVYGSNVGQVSQFIASGAAEIGITAKSMLMSTQLHNKGHWAEVPEDLYTPIGQGVIIIDRKEEIRSGAAMFYAFMFHDKTRQILVDHGYKLPKR